ncbi:MAG: pyruvate kinase [Rhodobiaceae bacterium]|nr:pyruvate kinase [Rhodobiaceae bacterium]MCC0016328.1 pyruvate kinase [Rhodobiaceae bacterium]MCC0041355.1 pyruvate kinase [Rhodobiaceae bacterium]MCC0052670.1 pyruvate kinase [Rhodobiaceae bacterium]
MRRIRKAKIVATLGPASSDAATIARLFDAGVDVFRLNFSHGTKDDHAQRMKILRDLEASTGRPIAVMQDLQGPKIRVGALKDDGFRIQAGETVRFVLEGGDGTAQGIPLPHREVFDAIAPGHAMLIDDGKLRLKVTGLGNDWIEAEVIIGGPVSNRKGVNLPDTLLALSPLTQKDRADLAFGMELGADFVALSFVQRAADVMECRQIIGNEIGIISKIEKPKALDDLAGIVALSDGVMVARGDLGVEIPAEEVPARQKDMIRLCRRAGKPVIIATQMLDSMVAVPSPTRAEASDVATAIYDGADAVMLSAESASGKYPVEAVAMMDRIITSTENHDAYRAAMDSLELDIEQSVEHAMAAAAALVAETIDACAIIAFTSSGTSAQRAARERPDMPIIALTPQLRVARQMALLWGAHSVQSDDVAGYDAMVEEAVRQARQEGFAKEAERIVILSGVPFGTPGSTNNLRVATIPRD